GTFNATARIGDGLYPLNDVDLYRVDVAAGQLLTAATTQPVGGTMMTPVLRLVDSAGHPLALNYNYPSANTTPEYQFGTAGTYSGGVSGYYTDSNPTVGGSGYPGASRGDYQLSLTLATPTADAAPDTIAAVASASIGPANGSFGVNGHIGDGLDLLRDVDL